MSYARATATPLTRYGAPAAGGFAREDEEAGLDLRDVAAILKRRKKVVWATTLLLLLATSIYLTFAPSIYTSRVQILFDPRAQKALDDDLAQEGLSPEGVNALIDSQLNIVESESVLRRVVISENLGADPEFGRLGLVSMAWRWTASQFGATPDDPARADLRALQALRREVGARRAEKTFVFDVFVSSEDKDKAARIANAVGEAYLRDQSAARAETARRASAALTARLTDLRVEVRNAERAVEQYKFQHNIVIVAGATPNIANNDAMIGLRELERSVDASRAVYQSFMARARQANEQSNMDRVNARIISHAEPPLNRSWPPRAALLGLALVGGLGLGSSLALARDHFDRRVHTKREIEEGTPFPVLAVVPRFLPIPLDLPREAERAFFRLRDAIRYSSTGRPIKIVMVTSCCPGEGKSAVASTLAAAAAAEGERVLLLEGQFCSRAISRRPKDAIGAEASDINPGGGVPAIASATGSELQTEVVPDFALPTIESVREARAHFEVVDKLASDKHKFDLIILDCGSVTSERLARHLAHVADSIIVVARAGQTRLEDIEEVAASLGVVADRVAGVVLNEARG